MPQKTLIYGTYTPSYRRSRVKKRIEIKQILKNFIEKLIIGILLLGTLFCAGGVFYRGYQWFRLRTIKQELLAENKDLLIKYNALTERNVVLRKAKKLGLRPPQKKDFINGGQR